MRTGIKSTKLALGILVIPFLFAYSPIIFTEHTASSLRIAIVFLTALAGMISFNIAMEGFLHNGPVVTWERLALAFSGVMLYLPEQTSNLIGLAVLGFFLLRRYRKRNDPGGSNNVQPAA